LLDNEAKVQVKVTKDQKKAIYSAITKLQNEKKASHLTKEQIWKYI